MFDFIARWLWRRKAKKVSKELCATCLICKESILPGEFVGQEMRDGLFHAGFHRSPVTGETVFCQTASIGVGFWNGKEVEGTGPSLAEQVFLSGKPMVGSFGPNGLKVETIPEKLQSSDP